MAPALLFSIPVAETFTHKLFLTVMAGFAAACLFWAFRHFVQEAFWESSSEGWKASLHGSTVEKSYH
jgi:hypothetical protein